MEAFVSAIPVLTLIVGLAERHGAYILCVCAVQALEIASRISYNSERWTFGNVWRKFSEKFVSPEILLLLFPDCFGLSDIFVVEISNFLVLRRDSRRWFDGFGFITLLICFAFGWFNRMKLLLLLCALLSRELRLLFHSYEVLYLQTLVSLAGINLSTSNSINFSNPHSPTTILFLAQYALFFLYISVLITLLISEFFKIRDNVQKTVCFGAILIICVTRLIWPVYGALVVENPLLWLKSLFIRDGYLGGYVSLYWVVLIGLFAGLAETAATKFGVHKVISRKIFHLLIVLMFLPLLHITKLQGFISYALAGAFAIFVLVEFGRIVLAPPLFKPIGQYFEIFILQKEKLWKTPIITSHISLLLATASTIWFSCTLEGTNYQSSAPLIRYFGLITVGIGDSFAAIFGSKFGRKKWPDRQKTIVGTFAAFSSMVLSTIFVYCFLYRRIGCREIIVIAITFLFTALSEVAIEANDNLFLPIYSVSLYIGINSII